VEVYIHEFGTFVCGADKELRPIHFNPREKPEATGWEAGRALGAVARRNIFWMTGIESWSARPKPSFCSHNDATRFKNIFKFK